MHGPRRSGRALRLEQVESPGGEDQTRVPDEDEEAGDGRESGGRRQGIGGFGCGAGGLKY